MLHNYYTMLTAREEIERRYLAQLEDGPIYSAGLAKLFRAVSNQIISAGYVQRRAPPGKPNSQLELCITDVGIARLAVLRAKRDNDA